MKRVMYVLLPTLAIDLVRLADRRTLRSGKAKSGTRHERRPILLIATARQRRVVVAYCERAAKAGVSSGMPLSDAAALLPRVNPRVLDHTPRRDRLALRRLAERLQRFSPITAVDEPDGLLLDIDGCAHLFGGENALLRQVTATVRRIGFTIQAAIASTIGCAWAIARYGENPIIPPGNERPAMEPLPIEALRLTEESRLGMSELSIEQVSQLLKLPRSAIPARFAPDVLARLDEAFGSAAEFVEPVIIEAPLEAECLFEGPTTRIEAIELATRQVIGKLIPMLLARECGLTRLELVYLRSDLPPELILIPLTRPSRDPKHLWSLVRPRLERINIGFGVCGVTARVTRIGLLRHEQSSLPEINAGDTAMAAHDEAIFAEMLDAIVNRCGPERVRRFELVESHVPEYAVRSHSVLDPLAPSTSNTVLDASNVFSHSLKDRPTMLFNHPEPVQVIALTPDGPLSRVSWHGEDHSILRCVGPERIEREWWYGKEPFTAAPRDYFKVQTEQGRWLWLYRQHASEGTRWFVHGAWA